MIQSSTYEDGPDTLDDPECNLRDHTQSADIGARFLFETNAYFAFRWGSLSMFSGESGSIANMWCKKKTTKIKHSRLLVPDQTQGGAGSGRFRRVRGEREQAGPARRGP